MFCNCCSFLYTTVATVMSIRIFLLVFFTTLCDSAGGFVHRTPLSKFHGHASTQDNNRESIYFLETSGRCTIKGRQACTIESAAKSLSGMNVVVLTLCDHLDLSHEVTKVLFESVHMRVTFLFLDPGVVFEGERRAMYNFS